MNQVIMISPIPSHYTSCLTAFSMGLVGYTGHKPSSIIPNRAPTGCPTLPSVERELLVPATDHVSGFEWPRESPARQISWGNMEISYIYGGFHRWGYPQMDGLYSGKSYENMDDFGVASPVSEAPHTHYATSERRQDSPEMGRFHNSFEVEQEGISGESVCLCKVVQLWIPQQSTVEHHGGRPYPSLLLCGGVSEVQNA